MNRQRAKELLPVIQAFAEGKTIQQSACGKPSLWLDIPSEHADVAFSRAPECYRIKPEPKLRPHNADELKALVGKILLYQPTGAVHLVTGFTDVGQRVRVASDWYTKECLFKEWQHLDGSPCGVLE